MRQTHSENNNLKWMLGTWCSLERNQSNTYLTIYFYLFKSPHRFVICHYNYLDLSSPTSTGIFLTQTKSLLWEKHSNSPPGQYFCSVGYVFSPSCCLYASVYVHICSEQQHSLHAFRKSRTDADEHVLVTGKASERSGRTCCESISLAHTTQ